MMKLMYITADPEIAAAAQAAGVDWIFVDMETIGKAERQGGMDTVQSHHTVEDIRKLRPVLTTSQLLVRCNPIHSDTEAEIDAIVDAGADIIMLPFFQTAAQVARFLLAVRGRAKTMLLIETPEAVENLREILSLPAVDLCHIGLNDLHLGYHKRFLFEMLTDGTTEYICKKLRSADIPYGFGGIARPGAGMLPAERILGEHVRLGSDMVILSRAFYDQRISRPEEELRRYFAEAVADVRAWEKRWAKASAAELEENRREVVRAVEKIVEGMRK